MTIPLHRAVFLDRDGTLNEECNYLHRPEDWRWLPGVVDGLAKLHQADYLLVVITNQAGIARGYYTEEQVHALHTWVNLQLRQHGVSISGFYFCPHHPEFTHGGCTCRKPSPLLLKKASVELDIDLGKSWMVGDKLLDIQAGNAAGCRSILVRTGYGEEAAAQCQGLASIATNFSEAAAQILRHSL